MGEALKEHVVGPIDLCTLRGLQNEVCIAPKSRESGSFGRGPGRLGVQGLDRRRSLAQLSDDVCVAISSGISARVRATHRHKPAYTSTDVRALKRQPCDNASEAMGNDIYTLRRPQLVDRGHFPKEQRELVDHLWDAGSLFESDTVGPLSAVQPAICLHGKEVVTVTAKAVHKYNGRVPIVWKWLNRSMPRPQDCESDEGELSCVPLEVWVDGIVGSSNGVAYGTQGRDDGRA